MTKNKGKPAEDKKDHHEPQDRKKNTAELTDAELDAISGGMPKAAVTQPKIQ